MIYWLPLLCLTFGTCQSISLDIGTIEILGNINSSFIKINQLESDTQNLTLCLRLNLRVWNDVSIFDLGILNIFK